MPKTSTKKSAETTNFTVNILDNAGQQSSTFELAPFFTEEEIKSGFNPHFVHQIVLTYLDNQRQATSKVKTRAEVRGGGRKPWKQKGTGRARQGSIRSPQWRHGGIVFGPNGIRNFSRKLTDKMKTKAMRFSILSFLAGNQLVVLESLESFDSTRKFAKYLNTLPLSSSNLIVLDQSNLSANQYLANLDNVHVKAVNNLSPLDLFRAQTLLCTKAALEQLLNRVKAK